MRALYRLVPPIVLLLFSSVSALAQSASWTITEAKGAVVVIDARGQRPGVNGLTLAPGTMVAAGDTMRMVVEGDTRRVIDSPARPAGGPAAAAPKASARGNGAQRVGQVITSTPGDLDSYSGGLASGEVAVITAALVAENAVRGGDHGNAGGDGTGSDTSGKGEGNGGSDNDTGSDDGNGGSSGDDETDNGGEDGTDDGNGSDDGTGDDNDDGSSRDDGTDNGDDDNGGDEGNGNDDGNSGNGGGNGGGEGKWRRWAGPTH